MNVCNIRAYVIVFSIHEILLFASSYLFGVYNNAEKTFFNFLSQQTEELVTVRSQNVLKNWDYHVMIGFR